MVAGPDQPQSPAWRNFRRMQAVAAVSASLMFAAAGLYAWRVLPPQPALVVPVVVVFPAAFALAVWAAATGIAPLRRRFDRFVWASFTAGFGQTPLSVLVGVGLLAAAAAFIFQQIGAVDAGGRYPAGVFSGYGAGIGGLYAQVQSVRRLEREAGVRKVVGGSGGGGRGG